METLIPMNERELKIYNKGIQAGYCHTEPSKKTMEEISKIKENSAVMNEKLTSIEEKIDAFLKKLEELEECKADKIELERVRKNIDWAVKLVLSGVILALLALVIKY